MLRKRVKHTKTFEERLEGEAERLRDQARLLKPGRERESLLRKARQMDTAAHLNGWLSSPGLRPAD